MPKATSCNLNGRPVHIEDALAMRRRGVSPPFRCTECDEPVRPHKRGTTGQAAHFEHEIANQRCRLSTSH